MQPKATIQVLVVTQVSNHFLLVLNTEDSVYDASDVQGDDQTRQQKHGTPIVARPVPVMRLQCLVKVHSRPKRALAVVAGGLRSLRYLHRDDKFSWVRGLHPEHLIRAVFLLMPRASKTIPQAFKLCLLLWSCCVYVFPGLSASVVIQRSKPRVTTRVSGSN